MDAHIITIFPEFFEKVMDFGIFKIATSKEKLNFYIHNLRDFTKDKHKTTDDRPYGGGAGMVMLLEPVVKSFSYIEKTYGETYKILISPPREKFNQEIAHFLATKSSLTFLPAHYEGIDERVMPYVDMELSIGDYVLSGGELPSLVVLDAVTRLLPGVLGNEESANEESFSNGLLEYPHFTRPSKFDEEEVPEVLLSGNHEKIRKWRLKESLKRTLLKRPDLLMKRQFTEEEKKILNEILSEIENISRGDLKVNFYISLVHYPVYNKNREIIATSIVIHDLHDMSRASKTFGVKKFFVVQPFEEERKIVERIVKFWNTKGKEYNPNRVEAISVLEIVEDFDEVVKYIEDECGKKPVIVGTSAQKRNGKYIEYEKIAKLLFEENPVLVVFGTGWGISDDLGEKFDYFLPPIIGITEFNHLSVRSACSIILDRIISRYKELL